MFAVITNLYTTTQGRVIRHTIRHIPTARTRLTTTRVLRAAVTTQVAADPVIIHQAVIHHIAVPAHPSAVHQEAPEPAEDIKGSNQSSLLFYLSDYLLGLFIYPVDEVTVLSQLVIVRDHDHAFVHLPGQLLEDLYYFLTVLTVKVSRRLISHDDR